MTLSLSRRTFLHGINSCYYCQYKTITGIVCVSHSIGACNITDVYVRSVHADAPYQFFNASWAISLVSMYVCMHAPLLCGYELRVYFCRNGPSVWVFANEKQIFHEWVYLDILNTWYPHIWRHLHDGQAGPFWGNKPKFFILQKRCLSIYTYVIGNVNRVLEHKRAKSWMMAVPFSSFAKQKSRIWRSWNCLYIQ